MDHIFTVNKEDAIVSHSPSPIAPHSPMHNKSDPLCQHRSLHTDKKVIVCSVICYKMQEEFEAMHSELDSRFPSIAAMYSGHCQVSVKTLVCFACVKLLHLVHFSQICVPPALNK